MTLKHFKNWSLPFCLSACLAGQVFGEDFVEDAAGPAAGTITDAEETDGTLIPVPAVTPTIIEEAEAPLPEEEVEEVAPSGPRTAPPPAPPAIEADTAEVVDERYANGALKISREVVQDAAGNYLNHGAWKMFSERGAVIVEGQYYEDHRHGVWNRWYSGGEVAFLRAKPFTDFSAPFISQGMFDSGDLHGAWIVYDSKQRKVCEIRFNHGEREGTAIWWHPNGRKMREMTFEKGVVHGDVTEWRADGQVVSKSKYDQGRKHITQTVHFGGDLKKYSGEFLEPELQTKTLDNWWKGEMAVYTSTGKPIKHGAYSAWHPTGQLRMKGEYNYDVPVGTFTWWYANGQKALEGDYTEGKQEGEWSWWHENGQRSIRGYFTGGNPSGKWTWWNKEGKVAQSGDFSDEKGSIVVAPMVPAPQQAEAPAAPTQPKSSRR